MQHDYAPVEGILARYPRDESSLVMVLQDVQAHYRYLPCEALERVAEVLAVPRSRVFSVATFYKAFSLEPEGRAVIQVCKGTACHVRGAQLIEDALVRKLGVPVDGTTADRAITLRTVNCVGACNIAPVVVVGEQYLADCRPEQVDRIIRRAREAGTIEEPPPPAAPTGERFASPAALLAYAERTAVAWRSLVGSIRVCVGRSCLAGGSRALYVALREAAAAAGLPVKVELSQCQHHDRLLTHTGCQGLCQTGPLVHVVPGDVLYAHVKDGDAAAIVEAVANGTVVERLVSPEGRGRAEHPFFKSQKLMALATCGQVDPESLDGYLAVGGFRGLVRALTELDPAKVVDAVDRSGLRGRGGAGFPTGRKWRSALAAAAKAGRPPYVLVNGDEGDPGAFMDRAIMEGSPFQVLEGMILGAYALGAREGYLYVRAEYPLALTRLGRAIDVLRHAGLLGERILGTDLSFDVRISRGGGAFVCGESTALMRSLEGKVGEPRAKYVRSVEKGLYDSPTVLNNVETWSLVPGIVLHGPEWLSSIGTRQSKGTKAFALVGQVRRTGLVEVPMGTTLRELVFTIGGGVREGRTFKAVQTGGPSGGCLPESQLDLPIDFDALTDAGSMMGSGGLIVMDDQTCMVDVARYFVDFLKEESCGKCGPCRLGLPQLSYLLGRVTHGKATAADLSAIEDVCQGIADSSLCGLGKSAPNPVLSTLRYFRDEYQAHLEGRCPAGVCRDLIRYRITSECTGCLACIKPCPESAITGKRKDLHVIDQSKCTRCGICRSVCKFDAVSVTPGGAN